MSREMQLVSPRRACMIRIFEVHQSSRRVYGSLIVLADGLEKAVGALHSTLDINTLNVLMCG
jgi:hypothetical protein